MNILNIKILRGPNYWSNYRQKLIVLKLDLEKYEDLPTNLLPEFKEKLSQLIPSLYSHTCSIGCEGGLFKRIEEGTWLGHVIEHIALELQNLAGMDCGFGRTYGAHEHGVYHVIFSYDIEEAGVYAGYAAVNIARCLAEGKDYHLLEEDLAELKRLFEKEQLGPSTQALLDEAKKRKIPYTRLPESSLIIFGQGCKQKRIWASVSENTSAIGVDLAANKEMTKNLLFRSFIPVPEWQTVRSLSELHVAVDKLHFPLTIKPINGNHGRAVTTNIFSKEKALHAFNLAKEVADEVIVERFIQGDDYRFLVINNEVVAVAKRTPAFVVGDGICSIQELIDKANCDPKRGKAHENLLTAIKVDEDTLSILAEHDLSLETVLPGGKILYLKHTANLSSGGTATDVTDIVHPDNKALAQRVARLIGLDVCGIDIICKNIRRPLANGNGAIIEVNAGPGLRMHLAPSEGLARNVAIPFIDMLYPRGSSARIPITAVTGTNGKTTVVRLIAYLAQKAKHSVGFSTTEGIYLNGNLVYRGDCSGPLSAAAILQDPSVDFAVLECARGGILRSGLGFDQCDISIITNISADHLGLEDIHSLEELTRVKAVVAYSTKKEGYAILNADDERVYGLKEDLDCQVALFALEETQRIKDHCLSGGLAAYVADNVIVVQREQEKLELAQLNEIPLSFNGTAVLMIKNILPAVLAGVISGFSAKLIQQSLYEFQPCFENTPGRMNIINFGDFQVMVDYAHNEDAYVELSKFLTSIPSKYKIGIIAASGDRRDEDIRRLGYWAAQIFDDIIIRHNKDDRGRSNEETTRLLREGIESAQLKRKVMVISEEFSAVRHAISSASPDSFIFYAVDDVFDAAEFILEEKRKFEEEFIM
ncbi:cyanophycin synthetase [Legionella jordanis]|uniref:Cyanophycin synthetase n=1 Tax=Legionella jordanis TaxID=456 RepID=A0A0W0V937_9GAMM|nr:cyanophycin synthetase [Legionella jordanis]KTD16610.1 cyanophycin synthetase [Legionella jordanis]RMX03851.1 cyanophycin synthetase [Legionella jordanis]RMX22087.1 cyanophycin synthetase [Legionella jordanis]VEH11926.1 cyanophycin synthetase [Legionella jordanis]HAT8712770.1 cyanophycin synthetase [Legionella jordanis]